MANIQPSNAVHYKLKDKIQVQGIFSFQTSISTKRLCFNSNFANKRVLAENICNPVGLRWISLHYLLQSVITFLRGKRKLQIWIYLAFC